MTRYLLLALGALTLTAQPARATAVCERSSLIVTAPAAAPDEGPACLKEGVAYGTAVVNYGVALVEWTEANKTQDATRMLLAAQRLDQAAAGVLETGVLLTLCLITLL